MNAHSPASTVSASSAPAPLSPFALAYRAAMHKLAGSISILTLGHGEARDGVTVETVTPLTFEPASLVVVLPRTERMVAQLRRHRSFAINVLRSRHQALAEKFDESHALEGAGRFAAGQWTRLETDAPVLADALASFDCDLEERIERPTHLILFGRVVASRVTEADGPLLRWGGGFHQISD